ncbi:MAG: pyrimidine reductase family protein [Carbonactinosporaceae bacterium]
MRCLVPARPDTAAEDPDLERLYAYPPARPWLRANMVASLDGAATSSGRSGELSDTADRRLFRVLRGLADVILVGAATVRKEGYGAAKARPEFAEGRAERGQPPAPRLAVVSRTLDLDFTSSFFTASTRTTILAPAAAPADRLAAAREVADVIIAGDEVVDVGRAVDALAGPGHERLLCEGGPHLLAQIVAAGRLDELCLTLSPRLTAGDAPRILAGQPEIVPPAQLRLDQLLEQDGFLFARYLLDTARSA